MNKKKWTIELEAKTYGSLNDEALKEAAIESAKGSRTRKTDKIEDWSAEIVSNRLGFWIRVEVTRTRK